MSNKIQIYRQKALEELGIPEDMYDELVQMFVPQTDPAIEELDAAIKSQDRKAIGDSAHFIKGAAGNLRIEDIYELSMSLEAGAKKGGTMEDIAKNFSALRVAYDEFKKNVMAG